MEAVRVVKVNCKELSNESYNPEGKLQTFVRKILKPLGYTAHCEYDGLGDVKCFIYASYGVTAEWVDVFAILKKKMPSENYERLRTQTIKDIPELKGLI